MIFSRGGRISSDRCKRMVDQAKIHRKVVSDDVEERREAMRLLSDNFADLPDKKEAWEDLIRFTGDEDSNVRSGAAVSLGSAFPYVFDKDGAWEDLIRLTQNKDDFVRFRAADAFGSAFPYVSDKDGAWEDLIRLTQDNDSFVQSGAAYMLGSAFPYFSDKDEAWEDLHRLTRDEDFFVRSGAAYAFGSAFLYVPDKDGAWEDLIRLTQDKDSFVRSGAAFSLGSTFPYFSDKDEAWKNLHRLTQDEDCSVRSNVAGALGSAFPYVPDKDEAWEDLHRLTRDEDSYVRAFANHSLGRASAFRATEAESEDDFESELKNAIEFFERSSKEKTDYNPSRFCFPFYRSFYTVTFEKEGAEDEVRRYLADAKSASKGSKNKEQLLEAVENLANALSEAQKVTDFDATKSNLKTYMQYCNRAADLISNAAEDAPGAAGILRRGIPIIGERICEIQEKAEALCRETRGTPLEELGLATARSAQELPTQDLLALMMALGNMAQDTARNWCEYLPTDKKVDACEQLKNLTDMEILERGAAIIRVFKHVQESIHLPKIQTVPISETEQEIVRIAVAQISFELIELFPFTVKNRDEVKTKIFSALEIAKQDGANIVCLPELCLYEEWISEIKGKYPGMIVIGGSFYKDNKNICPVIMESDTDTPYQSKITPSPFEDRIMGPRMIPGDRIYRYETRFGKFVILICMDFDDLAHFFRETDIDMIFCPSFNSANERFHNEAHSHVERTPSYILIANTGLHGGTSIFGQLNNKYFGGLVDGGCKKRGDSTYKLCEVEKGQEEVIIADFNLDHKGAQVPTPSNPNKVMKSVDNIKKIPIQTDRSRI